MKLFIIGNGFVGKAVDYGFAHKYLEKIIIDPKEGTSVEDLKDENSGVVFICVPTPMNDDGSVNGSIVKDVANYLLDNTQIPIIVIKSTITPDIISELQFRNQGERVVYNPEFLTERNYAGDFINPDFHILGGIDKVVCSDVEAFYKTYSKCRPCPVHYMSGAEASFVKYGINSFLASKVLWFNQFYDAVTDYGCDYNTVLNTITSDDRITKSHTQVPGFDGKKGFAGPCFPKDVKAFSLFAPDFSVLEEVIKANNKYRLQYEPDAREKEQNIHYDFGDET